MGTYYLNGTYNRIPRNVPPVQEFVEPNPSDHFIWFLFKHRCIECKQSATEINEIIPRSRSKLSIMNWKNRVLLCRNCHDRYHSGGVTEVKMNNMIDERRKFLASIGRELYI